LCAVCEIFSHSAPAADTGDFSVSSDFSLSEQNNPSITVNSDGSYAVIWEDYRNGQSDIYCQLYDSATVTREDNFALNDDVTGAWQFEPTIASDWNGSYYAVWKDYRNNVYPFDPDVYFQRLALDGPIGSNINITSEPPDSSHQSPSIDVTGWGRAVVCWTDLRNRNWDVFVRLLDSSGAMVSESYRANDDAGLTPQHEPDVAVAPGGWFVAVWYDGRNGNDDIYLQKYDSAGNAVGPNLRVNDDGGISKQKFPSVAIGENGVVSVVWTDWRNGDYPDNSDIYGQRFDSALNRLGTNRMINAYGAGTSQRHPRVAVDHMGNACVVWSDSADGDWNIMGQTIGQTGEFRGDNFPVNVDLSGRQLHPDVALDGYRAYFAWADHRNGNFDIYGRVMHYNEPRLAVVPSHIETVYDRGDAMADTISITVSNAGYGDLDFGVVADREWLSVSKSSGRTPDSLAAIIEYDMLTCGLHRGSVRLIDIANNDSSLHIPVVVSISTQMIATDPGSIVSMLYGHETEDDSARVLVIGSTGTGWSASSGISWLTLNTSGGNSGDFLTYQASGSSLAPGTYSEHITIEDTSAGNSPYNLPCTLQVMMTDTLGTLAAQAEPGKTFRQSLFLNAHNQILSGSLLCEYDAGMIVIDSFTVSASADSTMTLLFDPDGGLPRFWIRLEADSGQGGISPADYYLGDLWGTANDSLSGTTALTAAADSLSLILEPGRRHIPVWEAGPIEISVTTDVDEDFDEWEYQPVFALEQNRPNPFNSTTSISFSLARSGPVRVHIYNILGQLVRVALEGDLETGVHTVTWDGRDAAGREMASGIFFYKLLAPDYSAVRKMILLK